MNILLLSGTHSRHLYYFSKIISTNHNFTSLVMERETLMPDEPIGIDSIDRINFKKHFESRLETELNGYGDLNAEEVFKNIKTMFCKPDEFNKEKVIKYVSREKYDLCLIFGTDLIKENLMSVLPNKSINLHLGISPYFKGSATLFWPFYFLMPQFCGATFHLITNEPDAGKILHHSTPKLSKGEKIHEVAVNVVKSATEDMVKLISNKKIENWNFYSQKNIGKLFLESDFHPSHLRIIYNEHKNLIVDKYLEGSLTSKKPKLINAFN